MGIINTTEAGASTPDEKSSPLGPSPPPPSYTMTAHDPAPSIPRGLEPIPHPTALQAPPLTGDLADWKKVVFAKQILHSWLLKPEDPEITLSIFASTDQEKGIEINIMTKTFDAEAKRLISRCRSQRLVLRNSGTDAKDTEHRKKDRTATEIQLALKTLEDWASYGPSDFGKCSVLVGQGKVGTFK